MPHVILFDYDVSLMSYSSHIDITTHTTFDPISFFKQRFLKDNHSPSIQRKHLILLYQSNLISLG